MTALPRQEEIFSSVPHTMVWITTTSAGAMHAWNVPLRVFRCQCFTVMTGWSPVLRRKRIVHSHRPFGITHCRKKGHRLSSTLRKQRLVLSRSGHCNPFDVRVGTRQWRQWRRVVHDIISRTTFCLSSEIALGRIRGAITFRRCKATQRR
jgi:hypothetical protein